MDHDIAAHRAFWLFQSAVWLNSMVFSCTRDDPGVSGRDRRYWKQSLLVNGILRSREEKDVERTSKNLILDRPPRHDFFT